MQCRRLTANFEILTSIALLLSTLSDSHLLQMGRLEDGRSLLLKVCWVRAIRKESGSDAFGWRLTGCPPNDPRCAVSPSRTENRPSSATSHQEPRRLARRRLIMPVNEKEWPTNTSDPLEVSTGLKSLPLRLTPKGVAPSKGPARTRTS